ncbi:hypothetical protein LLH06_06890 [Mucilaginibacter daejeonensis]|uniref:hypothetical protein n=1 Tax=Mucilaginibacter daejeonensis TaxID=398049 RepID=UPI001D17AEA2|nr:hypothetical protein [Mucilaginibacter daejeonensis]UEG54686.1 hypothetical protein LLH06_06890 [Mucilaginibacter daejeonensis]
MNLLPYQSYLIKSKYTRDEVIERFLRKAHIDTSSEKNETNSGYSGNFYGCDLKIAPICNYRNGAYPEADLIFVKHMPQAEVKVKIRVNTMGRRFLLLWIGIVLSLFLICLIEQISSNAWSMTVLAPLGMALAGYAIMLISYHLEVPDLRNFVEELLLGN